LYTVLYLFVGAALSGVVAAILMNLQYKIETKLHPNYWILNIIIELFAFAAYTYGIFWLMYL
jgi:hypothetical protein